MGHKPIKYVEKAVTVAAQGAWFVYDKINSINPNPSFTPKWSDKPLLKSYQKSKPPLGWPRTTDSLCPRCVPEVRQQIVDGKLDSFGDSGQNAAARNVQTVGHILDGLLAFAAFLGQPVARHSALSENAIEVRADILFQLIVGNHGVHALILKIVSVRIKSNRRGS